MSILWWPPASARAAIAMFWKSDKLNQILTKFVRKISPEPQTYQIKAKRADSVRTCCLFSNERTPFQVTEVWNYEAGEGTTTKIGWSPVNQIFEICQYTRMLMNKWLPQKLLLLLSPTEQHCYHTALPPAKVWSYILAVGVRVLPCFTLTQNCADRIEQCQKTKVSTAAGWRYIHSTSSFRKMSILWWPPASASVAVDFYCPCLVANVKEPELEPNWPDRPLHLLGVIKGQLISKCLWYFQFSQKNEQKNSTLLLWYLKFKVHIFWEGHKILQNLHLTFDWHYIGQK